MAISNGSVSQSEGKPAGRISAKTRAVPKISVGGIDLTFLIIIMILLTMGIVMMFSASYAIAVEERGDGFFYFKKQAILAAFGVFVMLIISRIDYHILQKAWIAYGLFFVSLILLVLVPFIGIEEGDTGIRRWIAIGPLPQFQPSEIMKAAIVILFAYIIAANYKRMKQFKYGMLPFGIVLGVVCLLLYLQPHYSGIILIGSIGVVMMFVGGTNIKHLLLTALAGLTGVAGLIYFKMVVGGGSSTFTNRIQAWLTPFDSPIDTWQTKQSLIAIGSGGLFGLGLGNSRQKYLYLPASHNDFVFSIICEELGFIGALMVILLFVCFVFRGFYIASKSPDKFGMMLAVGLTFQIGIQALLNIAVATNTIPNTGISLPFFSYGGTALVMQLAEMGVILNVSRQSLAERE